MVIEKWYDKDERIIKKYKEIIMLGLNEKELEKIKGIDEFMNNYVDEIKGLNYRDQFSEFITPEEDNELIMRSIIDEEREEAQKEGIIQMAKNMLSKDININTVIEITGLTKEEIEKL